MYLPDQWPYAIAEGMLINSSEDALPNIAAEI